MRKMARMKIEDGKDEDGKDENLVVAIETSGEGRATDEGEEGETAPSCHHHQDLDHHGHGSDLDDESQGHNDDDDEDMMDILK